MNCDTAFDLMTDPHGGRSNSLREHLAGCARCRQMQETLAPALDWLSEPAPLDADQSLHAALLAHEAVIRPGALATAEARQVALEAAGSLSVRCAPPAVRFGRAVAVVLRSAALVAFGAFLASSFAPDSQPAGPDPNGEPCRRYQAAEMHELPLSANERNALIASCAACHHETDGKFRLPRVPAATPLRDRRQGALSRNGSRLIAAADWGFPVL